MTMKLKIDLSQGQIEVEGDNDDKVIQACNDLMKKIEDITPQIIHLPAEKPIAALPEPKNDDEENTSAKPKKKATQKKPSTATTFKMVTELFQSEDAKKIKQFYEQYDLKTHPRKVTTFVYFMEKKLNIKNISADHLYTCYKIIGQKSPKVLQQAVRDAKSQKGWLIHDDWNDLKITHTGEEAVEYDFEKKSAQAA